MGERVRGKDINDSVCEGSEPGLTLVDRFNELEPVRDREG